MTRIPPAPTMLRGILDSFAEADGRCETPDDQIHILPAGWAFGGDSVEPDVVCRPRDPSDSSRYLSLREEYGDEIEYAEMALLGELDARLARTEETLRAALR